jgi:hypothetical protein
MLPENAFASINYSLASYYHNQWLTQGNKPQSSLPTIGPGKGIWLLSNENTTLVFDELK